MDGLDLVVELILSDERFKAALQRIVTAVENTSTKAEREAKKIERAWSRIGDSVGQSVDRMVGKIELYAGALATIAAGAATRGAVGLASEFEKSIAGISTLLGEGSVSIERYQEDLLALSQTSSKDILDLSQGLYEVISAGIPAVEGASGAFATLEAAQRAAIGGFSTTEDAANAVIAVMNSYGRENITAARSADVLLQAANVGKTNLTELGESLGRVLPIAAQFGVSIEDAAGLLITLTNAGLSTSEAVTGVRGVLTGIAKPSEQAQKELKKLGLEFSVAKLQAVGLTGLLEELTDRVGNDPDQITRLFPNIEGLLPAITVVGKGFGALRDNVDAMGRAAGVADRNFKIMGETFSGSSAILKNQFNAVLIEAGTRVLPLVQARVKQLTEYLANNSDEIADGFERFAATLDAIVEFVKNEGVEILKWMARLWAAGRIFTFTRSVKEATDTLKELGGVGAKIASVLKGASFAAAALAAAALLGQAIGEKIGEAMTASFAESAAQLEAEMKARIDEINTILAKRGFKSVEEQQRADAQVRGGDLIPASGVDVGAAGGLVFDSSLASAADLVKEQGDAAIQTAENVAIALQESAKRIREQAARETEQFLQQREELVVFVEESQRRIAAIDDENRRSFGPDSNRRERTELLRAVADAKAKAFEVERSFDQVNAAARAAEERAAETEAGAQKIIQSVEAEIAAAKLRQDQEQKARKKPVDADAAKKRAEELRRLLQMERDAFAERASLELASVEAGLAGAEAAFAEKARLDEREIESQRRLAEQQEDFANRQGLSDEQRILNLKAIGVASSQIADAEARALTAQIVGLRDLEEQSRVVADARIDAARRAVEQEVVLLEEAAAELAKKQPRDRARIEALVAEQVSNAREAGAQDVLRIERELNARILGLAAERLDIEDKIADVRRQQRDALEEEAQGYEKLLRDIQKLGEEKGSQFFKDIADQLLSAMGQVAEKATDNVEAIYDQVAGIFGSGAVAEQAVALVENIIEAIEEAKKVADKILAALADATAAITRAFSSLDLSDLVSVATSFGQSFNEAVVAPLRALLGDGVLSELAGGLLEVPGRLLAQLNSRFIAPFTDALAAPLDRITSGLGDAVASIVSSPEDAREERDRINADFDQQIANLREGGASESRVAAVEGRRREALADATSDTSPVAVLDETFKEAAALVERIVAQLPQILDAAIDRLVSALPGVLQGVFQAAIGVIDVLVARLGELFSTVLSALLDALPGLIQSLVPLLGELIIAVVDGVTAVLSSLPEVVAALIDGLLAALPDLLGRLIPALVRAGVELVRAIITLLPTLLAGIINLIPAVIDGFIAALPDVIAELIAAAPLFVYALVQSAPRLIVALVALLPRLVASVVRLLVVPFSKVGEIFGKVGDRLADAGREVWRWLTSAGRWLFDVFMSVGRFFQKIINGVGDFFGDAIGGVGSFFHDGGIVGGVQSVPINGVFHDGGPVTSYRRQVQGLARDESLNVLQDGEVVLSRAAVSALGGARNADRLNGRGAFQTETRVTIQPSGNPVNDALLRMLIAGVTAEMRAPGGTMLSRATQSAASSRIQGARR